MGSDFEEFGFGGEEFFPLDDASIMDSSSSKGPNLPGETGKKVKGIFGKSKSYFKNVAKSVKGVTFSVARDKMPNVVDFAEAISETVKAGQDKASEQRQKASQKIGEIKDKMKENGGVGPGIGKAFKDMGNDLKKAVTTGEFYKDPNDIDIGAMFGDDEDMSFDDFTSDDFTSDGDAVADTSDDTPVSKAKTSASSSKTSKSRSKNVTMQSTKNVFNVSQGTSKHQMKALASLMASSVASSSKVQVRADALMHNASIALSEMQFKQQMGAYEAIYGAIEKIANFTADYGVKDISAGMEYRSKSIAMQEDTINLLKELKEATIVGMGVNALVGMKDDMSETEREKILGSNLNGQEYFNSISTKAKSMFSNTTLGSMIDAGGMAGDMADMTGKSKFQMGKDMVTGSIPGLFLSKKTKAKMERLNDIFGSMGGAMTMKFNNMARYSDNPIVRGLASAMGVDDMMAKRVDHGVKDPAAKAIFDNAAHRSLVEVIPGLLAKQLAASTGEEEIYYDMKSGAFKTSSSAVKQYKYEEERTYGSSVNLNESQERMTFGAVEAGAKFGLDPKDISDDFEKIKKNIIKSKMLFSPDLLMGKSNDSQEYRDFISKGLKHPDVSIRLYADQFSKLMKGDQLAYATGLAEVLQNREKFIKDNKQSMARNGAPAALVEHLEREDFEDRNTALATTHMREDKFKEGTNAQLLARKRKIEFEEKLAIEQRGRVNTTGGMYDDASATLTGGVNINDMAAGYNESKGPAAILSNIYNLLLDGVVVFPQNFMGADGNVPKHLQKRVGSRIQNAQAYQELSADREASERTKFEDLLKSKSEFRKTAKSHRVGMSQLSLGDVIGMKTEQFQNDNKFNQMFDKGASAVEGFSHKFLFGNTKNAGEGSAIFDELEMEGLERINQMMQSGKDTSLFGMLQEATAGKDGKFNSIVNSLSGKALNLRKKLANNATSWKDRVQASKEYEKVIAEAEKLKEKVQSASGTVKNELAIIKNKSLDKLNELDPNLSEHTDQAKATASKLKDKVKEQYGKLTSGLGLAMHGDMFDGDYDSLINEAVAQEKENVKDTGVAKLDVSSYYPAFMGGTNSDISSIIPQSTAIPTSASSPIVHQAPLTLPDILDVRLTDISLQALNKYFDSKKEREPVSTIDTHLITPSVSQPSTTDANILSPVSTKAKTRRAKETQATKKKLSKIQSIIQKKYQETVEGLKKIQDPEQRKIIIDDFYRNSQTLLSSIESRIPENVRAEYDKVRATFEKHSNTIYTTVIDKKKKFDADVDIFKKKATKEVKKKQRAIKKGVKKFKKKASDIYDEKKEQLGEKFDEFKGSAEAVFTEKKDQIEKGVKKLAKTAQDTYTEKKDQFDTEFGKFKESAATFYTTKSGEISESLKKTYDDFEARIKKATSQEERQRLHDEFIKFMDTTAPEKAQEISKKLKETYQSTSTKVIGTMQNLWASGVKAASEAKSKVGEKISAAKAERDARSQAVATPMFQEGSTINVFVTGFSKEAADIVSSFSPPNARDRKKSFKNALKQAKYDTRMAKREAKDKRKEEKAMRKASGKKGFIRTVAGGLAGGAVAIGKGAGSLAAGGVHVGGGVIGGIAGGVGSFAKNLFKKRKVSLEGMLKEVKKGKRKFDEALSTVRGMIQNGEIEATQGVAFLDKAVEMDIITRPEADKILAGWKKDKIITAADTKKYISNAKAMGGYTAGTGISLNGAKVVKSKSPGFIKNTLSGIGSALGIGAGGGANLVSAALSIPLGMLRNSVRKRLDQRYNDEKKLSGSDFKKIRDDIVKGRVSLPSAMHKLYEMMKRGQLEMIDLIFFAQEMINTDENNKDLILSIMQGWTGDGHLSKVDLNKYKANLSKHGSLTYGLKDPNIFKRVRPKGLLGSALSLAGGAVTLAGGLVKKGKELVGTGMNSAGKMASWAGNLLKGKKAEKTVDGTTTVRKGSALDILSSRSSRGQDSALLSMAKDVAAIRGYVSKLKGFPLSKKELEKTLKNGGGNDDESQNNGVSKWRSRLGKTVATAGTVAGGATIAAGAANMVRGSVGAMNKFGEASDMASEGASGGQVMGHVMGVDASGKYDWQGNEKNRTFMQSAQDNASVSKVAQAATGMRGITKAGKAVISGSKKMGQSIAKGTLKEGTGVVSKLTKFLQKMFTSKPFSNFIQKSVVGRLVKAIISKVSGSALGKFASKIASSIAKAAVPIGWAMIAADFVSGMSQTSRYFRLPKGVAPNLWMRVTSGIVNTLSGLLFGLLPPEIIAPLIYNLIASDETKEFLKEGKAFGAERANVLGVEPERLVEYETRPLGERMFGGDQKSSAQLGYGTKPEDIAAFKEWESKKYKPLQDIYNRVKEKYGGSVVEKEPSRPGDKEKQQAFRKEVLAESLKFIKSNKLDSLKPGSQKGVTPVEESTGEAEMEEKKTPEGVAAAAVAGSVGGDGSFGMTTDASSEPESKTSVSQEMPSASASSSGTPSVAASVASASGAASAATSVQGSSGSKFAESAKANIEKQPNASISEPPMITDAKEMTEVINAQLDAMKALLHEQTRHNGSVESFFEDLKELLIRGFKLDPAMQALDEARKKAEEDARREKESKGLMSWLKGSKSDEQLTKESAAALARSRGATLEFDVRTDVTSGT